MDFTVIVKGAFLLPPWMKSHPSSPQILLESTSAPVIVVTSQQISNLAGKHWVWLSKRNSFLFLVKSRRLFLLLGNDRTDSDSI